MALHLGDTVPNFTAPSSIGEINFYDFAEYFRNLGCKNALYLDGFVSGAWFPVEKYIHNKGNFGVMIGVTKAKEK